MSWNTALARLLAVSLLLSSAVAWADLATVVTPAGRVSIASAKGKACGNDVGAECKVAKLNDDLLFADMYVDIVGVYPNHANPKIVMISTHGGGNAIPSSIKLIDVSSLLAIILKEVFWDEPTITSGKGFLRIETVLSEQNEAGDHMVGVHRYKLGSGRLVLEAKFPSHNKKTLHEVKHPAELLADPSARDVILKMMGSANFKMFRDSVAVASDVTWIAGRFVVGEGMMRHSGGSSSGVFVVEPLGNRAWVLWNDEGTIRAWGRYTGDDDATPRRVMLEWAKSNNIDVRKVKALSVPMPNAIVGRPNQNVVAVDPSGRASGVLASSVSTTKELQPTEVYETVARMTYVVLAKNRSGSVLQGSAIAISEGFLVTNCHVVARAESLELAQDGKRWRARLASANHELDRCVLESEAKMKHFAPIRPFASVRIGETAYSIGAPQGLELTFANGLVSSKRTEKGLRLLQTTAPISRGSSGGGLFDGRGNLIGVTTFLLKDAQNINFAIAADDFIR